MTRARIESYDPRNAFTESERWAEQDLDDLRESKCLKYLWRCFDQSPLAHSVVFALPFRQTLADHLFAEAGEDLRLFGGIKIQCGHNIEIGDNVVVHNDVLLDDRGELVIGDRVSIADRAHLHTHSHDTVDQTDVTCYRTVLDDDVRLGLDSMIDAGVRVGENAMVGAASMVRGDVPATTSPSVRRRNRSKSSPAGRMSPTTPARSRTTARPACWSASSTPTSTPSTRSDAGCRRRRVLTEPIGRPFRFPCLQTRASPSERWVSND